jgi:UDP-4-amino-4,6-dideoxy-N-acetyl-beta-L-altrosamine transaminase
MKNKCLPYGKQIIDRSDINAVIEVLKSDYLTTGSKVEEFEKKLAKKVGSNYAVVVANATAGLHLAVLALDLPKKSEGITSPITFLASSNAMIYSGVKPVFADIKADTYNIDPIEISKKICNNTRLIMPVHFAGQACDMVAIKNIAKKLKLKVIEDAAHAIGSRYDAGEKVGSCKYSDMTVFSFHPVKTITTGEGGAITTNNKQLYEKLKILRNHGTVKNQSPRVQKTRPWYYEMKMLGYNYRLTDIQSALGISQLDKLAKFILKRKKIIAMYNKAFKNVSWITTPFEKYIGNTSFHLYVLQINFKQLGKTRAKVMNYLISKGIGTQVHYIPIHLQPYYKKQYSYKKGDYPVAESYYKKCLSIPLYPGLTTTHINNTIKSIMNIPRYA